MNFRPVFILILAALCGRAVALPITVDPAGPALTVSWSTEWNTNGDLESWTSAQVTGTAVSGGFLNGTSSGTDSKISRSNFSGGPDLDLGYNDFIELRVKVPGAYAGDIQVYYGTTGSTGFSAGRVLTIPSAVIPKDGAFHAYRIDVGPEAWWRGTLRDLRVDPVGGAGSSGLAFAIDYVRVGDLAGDVYLPNTTDQPVTAYELSSKHFRFIWDANRATNSGINATIARGCLRNAEEVWQVYVKVLGYREPAESTDAAQRNGNKYKVNFLCTYDGYWMGGSPTSFAYLNIDPSGLQVDPPTWVLPHEGMHVFQMHNSSGNVPGEWWETHANYGRERWLYHYANLYPNSSNIDAQAIRDAHFMMSSGRNYYLTWPFFLYVDENPDALPDLYDGMVAKVWQETQAGEFSMMALDRLTPTTSLKDIAGYYARRGATMNYSRKAALNTALTSQDATKNARHQFTDLVRRVDDPTWWRVPMEKAPAQGAYAIHELVPAGSGAGRVVTVNFHGLADSARGADWRASFVVVSDSGSERYSPIWNAGSQSVTLSATENKLYLVVAGTPDTFFRGGHDEATEHFRSHPSRSRFHYEVQVTGATPRERNNGATSGLVQHANGGGWKASTATVEAGAYLGPNARVLDTARVRNTARVEDFAVVQGAAQVLNGAIVSGHALVRDNAIVRDNARVRDWAIVEGSGSVAGNARVIEHATVSGAMTDSAVAKGSAISYSGTLSGNAIVDGDYTAGRDIANGVAFGHLPYVGVPDSFITPTPSWLYASYDFASAHDSRALDRYGVTDGYGVGSPMWISADAKRSGFLTFNGANQYVALDRSVADMRAFTFTAWVKPLGGVANQAVLWLGATTSKRLALTPDDGTGHVKFSIANGGADQTVAAPTALAPNVWTHVAVTLDGTTGRLFLNGTAAASAPVSIVPEQLLAANTSVDVQHNYLARSEASAMPMFRGSLDDAQFFTRALSAADISAMQPPVFSNTPPATSGTLQVDLRAGDATTAAWKNYGALSGSFASIVAPGRVTDVGGYPAVQFDGAQAYTGPNSVADIDGGGDRSVEVWVYNPAFSDEETVVSWGHRGSTRRNMALNFGSNGPYGVGAATHWDDDVGWTAEPSAAAWHHLAYTYSAGIVKVYVDGALAVTKTLGGNLSTFAGEPVNIGCQRESANGARSHFFSGYINTVRIHGGVLTAAQIAANAALGPGGPAPNVAPAIATIADQMADFGAALNIPVSISDADTAPDGVSVTGSASNATLIPPANIAITGTGALRTLVAVPAAGFTGATTITLVASDGVATANRSFSFTALTSLETWRRQNFGSIVNADNAADGADPDKDGLSNRLEFALGLDPKAPGRAPVSVVIKDVNLEYSYTRSIAAVNAGVVFTVEYSDTLASGTWSSAGVNQNPTPFFDDGMVQKLKVIVPAGTGSKRFVRLKTSKP